MHFWWQPPCLLRVVIVNLISDESTAIRGLLWQSRGSWLVVRDAQLLKAREAPVALDGDVVIPRANVAFLQVP